MELILSHDGNEYWLERLARPANFMPCPWDVPYVCLLWDYAGTANDNERVMLARWSPATVGTPCALGSHANAGMTQSTKRAWKPVAF